MSKITLKNFMLQKYEMQTTCAFMVVMSYISRCEKFSKHILDIN